jgi:simple sugar transport system ATP-binding protein
VKIIGGIHAPDEGTLIVEDLELPEVTPHQTRALGLEVVYQDLALCDNLPAGANVVLGQEPVRFNLLGLKFLDRQKSNELGRDRLAALGADIPDWQVPVRRLSGGQRQAIALARATVSGHRLIILDEPTAALGVNQTQATLDLVRKVAAQGVAVLIVMHNLDQVLSVSDRVVVLRLGTVTLDKPASETSKEEIVARMTGVAVAE